MEYKTTHQLVEGGTLLLMQAVFMLKGAKFRKWAIVAFVLLLCRGALLLFETAPRWAGLVYVGYVAVSVGAFAFDSRRKRNRISS